MANKTTKEINKNSSTIEMLWNQLFQNLDSWTVRESFRENTLLQAANLFAENVKRNQANVMDLVNQFSKEVKNWEKTSREELLTATISLQSLFPIKSYEDINDQLDHIKNQSSESILNSLENLVNIQIVDQYVSALAKYIELRRNNRILYVKSVKEVASIIQMNQNTFLSIFTNQVKNVFLPFGRFMERSDIK
ncbi:hypothetical protein ACIFOT_01175 [Neobacillus sp. NRS-1170]|uniref:hypothetical protein n=1 Tax=Neobacillus sp. NRS-1170 TaxID=3233898 RepID=UPI003D28515D